MEAKVEHEGDSDGVDEDERPKYGNGEFARAERVIEWRWTGHVGVMVGVVEGRYGRATGISLWVDFFFLKCGGGVGGAVRLHFSARYGRVGIVC